ncbi:MAG: transposase [Coprothermobacterota bacterium]|nr:transposase [Coprothermobacterota bacterium]
MKNPGNLSGRQQEKLDQFRSQYLETAKAYQLKLAFQDLYLQTADDAVAYLRHWCAWAARSGLEPFRKLARTIDTHRRGILRWFHSKMTNGLLEGINSLVQAAKAKARGYRSIKNLITMVYLIAGKLDFGWA